MAAITSSILAGVSALTSVIGGMQQQAAAKQEAQNAIATAEMQGKEQARVSVAQAEQAKQEAESYRREQKIKFLKSGVSLEGSPFLALEETRLQGQKNVDEILKSGASAISTSQAEGRMRAKSLKQSGRAAFISGLGNAASSFSKMGFGG